MKSDIKGQYPNTSQFYIAPRRGKVAMDISYFRVAAAQNYFDSDVSGDGFRGGNRYLRKPSVEFEKLFRSACDELKHESGNAHQQDALMGLARLF
ncbi:MAG: hypothetical protein SOX30_02595 [Lachnospiraceae bacterium]|nr:hypothetical protein [Lachnospiraceae bacterium]